jgi:hypothetical protein
MTDRSAVAGNDGANERSPPLVTDTRPSAVFRGPEPAFRQLLHSFDIDDRAVRPLPRQARRTKSACDRDATIRNKPLLA